MKKVFCLILALAMVLTFMPMEAHAASGSRTISGTLTFSSPVNEDTTIRIDADYAYGSFWDSGGSQSITVKKGATSVKFSFNVSPDVYTLWFYNRNSAAQAYYGVEDNLTNEWQQRAVFDLNTGSVSDLNVNGDTLLGSGSSNSSNVNVVVNFPEAKEKEVCIRATTEDGKRTRSSWDYVEAGETSASVSFSLDPKKKYYFSFADATGASDTGWEDYTGFLYAAEGGVSSLESNAKLYEFSAGSTITINYPSCYTISGTLDRTGYADGAAAAAYVVAEFADGERYADRVVFDASTKKNTFKIYVPQSQKGKSYTLYTAPAYGVTSTGVIKSKEKSVGGGTLTGNNSAGTVTMESYTLSSYSGTISLPSGVKASSEDVYVRLYSEGENYVDFDTFMIPAGSNSTSFSFYAEPGLSTLSADLCTPVAGAFYTTSVKVSNASGIKLNFAKDAVISGTVYLPDGVDTAYVGEINGSTDNIYCYTYFSIRRGEKSSKYYLHVPMDVELYGIYLYEDYDGDDIITEDNFYLDGFTVTGDKSDVDVHLNNPKTITGTVSRPDGMLGYIDLNVYVVTDYNTYETEVYFDSNAASKDYDIQISNDDDSTAYKLYYFTEVNGLKCGNWYLRSDGTFTQDEFEAESFDMDEQTRNFTPVPVDPFVKGKLYIPDSVEDGTSLYVRLSAALETNSGDYPYADTSFSINVDDAKLKTDGNGRYVDYLLGTEDLTEGGDFYLQYYADNEALDCNNYYVLADGSLVSSSEDTYYLTFDGDTPVTLDFTLRPWDDGNRYVFESAHGLKGETVTYTYTYPSECDSLTLTFNDRSNAYVAINGTEYPTAAPVTIEGNKAEVTVEFSGSRDGRYGFACTDITAIGVKKEKAGVGSVYTKKGGNEVVEEVKSSKEVSATFCTDGIAAGTKLVGHAALYDKDGRFLGLSKADEFVANDSSNAGLTLSFDAVSGDTAQVTVVVIDADYQPMGDCMTK